MWHVHDILEHLGLGHALGKVVPDIWVILAIPPVWTSSCKQAWKDSYWQKTFFYDLHSSYGFWNKSPIKLIYLLLPFPLVRMSKKTWRNIQERRFAPHCKGKTFKSGNAFNLNSSLFIQNIFRCPAPGKRGANPMACTNFPSGIKNTQIFKNRQFWSKILHLSSHVLGNQMSFIFRSDLIFDK